jgi:hypothetical protein
MLSDDVMKVTLLIFAVTTSAKRKSDAEKSNNLEKVGFEKAIELTGKSTLFSVEAYFLD